MTENLLTVTPMRSMHDTPQQILQFRLDSLPVGDRCELLDIVTTSDVLKAFVEGGVTVVRG